MTAKQIERKKTGEHISALHKKYYGKQEDHGKSKVDRAIDKRVAQKATEAVNKKLAQKGIAVRFATKKKADIAPGAAQTTGVGISGHPEQGNGKQTRAELMRQAQAQSIKYFRILHREELIEALRIQKIDTDLGRNALKAIQERAKKRWKAGWGSQGLGREAEGSKKKGAK